MELCKRKWTCWNESSGGSQRCCRSETPLIQGEPQRADTVHMKLRWFSFHQLDSRVLRQANKTARSTCKYHCLSTCSGLCATEKNYKPEAESSLRALKQKFIKCFLKQSQIMKYSQRILVKTRVTTHFCSRITVFFPFSCGRLMNFSDNVMIGLVATDIFFYQESRFKLDSNWFICHKYI